MKLSRIFKSVIATVLMLAMLCSVLSSCAGRPSDKALKKAYQNSLDKAFGKIELVYDKLDAHDLQDFSAEMGIDVDVSSQLVAVLRSLTSEDFTWINDVKLTLSENVNDDKVSLDLGMRYGKKDIVSVKAALDVIRKELYVSVPELAENSIKLGTEEYVDLSTIFVDVDYKDILPKQATLKKMIQRYFDIIMNNISDASYESKNLTVNGVAESSTLYEIAITEKLLAQTLLDIYTTAKEDADIKEVIYNAVDAAKELSSYSYEIDEDEIYNSFVEYLTQAIAAMEESIAEGKVSDKTVFEWRTYVASKGVDVIAVELEIKNAVDGKPYVIFAGRTQDGNKIGVNVYGGVSKERDFEIEGSFVEKGSKVSGTYEILVENKSMLFVDVVDFDTDKFDKGYLNGTISISPSKGMVEELSNEFGIEASMIGLSISTLSLKFDFEQKNENEMKFVASVLSGDEPYLSISLDSKLASGTSVNIPSNATEDVEEWVEGFDVEGFVKKVSKSGLPEYIIEWLEALASLM